jgi:hypothetical protein
MYQTTEDEHCFTHKVVSEIGGGPVVKFVFLNQCSEDKGIALMTNALDMHVGEDIYSYKRQWDLEAYHHGCN